MELSRNEDGCKRFLQFAQDDILVGHNIKAFGKAMNRENDKIANVKKCPFCGDKLIKRNGRYGAFWGCGSFPNCRYTENA